MPVLNTQMQSATSQLTVQVLDTANHVLQQSSAKITVPAQSAVNHSFALPLTNLGLWTPQTPTLYFVHVNVSTDGSQPQQLQKHFGVRTLSFTASHGFQINNVTVKLQGGCVHHDNGILGSAAIDKVDERRVLNLKAVGYNSIRTSHNPVSPAFLDACDKHGMFVMEEAFDCWSDGKNPDDYHLYFDEWWQRDMQVHFSGP